MRRLCADTNVGDLAVLGEGLPEERKKMIDCQRDVEET
jgi:hypothetical protein